MSKYHKAKMFPAAGTCQHIQAKLHVNPQLECSPSANVQLVKSSFGSSSQGFLRIWEKGPEEQTIIGMNLPTELLELIALQLPAADAICLASANRHCRDALQSEEFWQRKLTTDCPFWVNNGIVPWLGRPAGQSWQKLAIMAAQLQMAEEQNHALQYPLSDEARIAQLWTAAAGDEKLSLHLDWHLCCQEHNTGATGSNRTPCCEHIQSLLELVYFLWFQQKHLARGAKVLSKVLKELENLSAEAMMAQQNSVYGTEWLMLQLTFAGSLLMDLLQMRWQSIASADKHSRLSWCGGDYLNSDLRDALRILSDVGSQPNKASNPWEPKSWQGLCADGAHLLTWLQVTCQEVPAATTACRKAYTEEGHDIMRQVGSGKSPDPRGIFRAHKLFAASLLLAKMSRQTDLGSVYLDLVELFSQQHPSRAVYYLDLDGVEDDQHVLVEDFKIC